MLPRLRRIAQRPDSRVVDTQVLQLRFPLSVIRTSAPLRRSRRFRKARQRRRLHDAIDFDKRLARLFVRVIRRLGEAEYRRKADFGAGKMRAPVVARAGPEDFGEGAAEFRPVRLVHLVVETSALECAAFDIERCEQRAIKPRFDRTDRDPFSVGAFIVVVEVRAAIDDVARLGLLSR
jgi:hypothetical protein